MTTLRQTLEQARDALKAHCGGRCNAEYNPCADLEIADKITAALSSLDEAPGVEPAPSTAGEQSDTYDAIWNSLQRICTASVMLPTFEIVSEGGIEAVAENIVQSIAKAAALLSAPALPVGGLTDLERQEIVELLDKEGHDGTDFEAECPLCTAREKLAAARSQSELVPMTDDQIQEIYIRTYNIGHHGRNFENAFARAIEAHHGITNKATKEPQS